MLKRWIRMIAMLQENYPTRAGRMSDICQFLCMPDAYIKSNRELPYNPVHWVLLPVPTLTPVRFFHSLPPELPFLTDFSLTLRSLNLPILNPISPISHSLELRGITTNFPMIALHLIFLPNVWKLALWCVVLSYKPCRLFLRAQMAFLLLNSFYVFIINQVINYILVLQ